MPRRGWTRRGTHTYYSSSRNTIYTCIPANYHHASCEGILPRITAWEEHPISDLPAVPIYAIDLCSQAHIYPRISWYPPFAWGNAIPCWPGTSENHGNSTKPDGNDRQHSVICITSIVKFCEFKILLLGTPFSLKIIFKWTNDFFFKLGYKILEINCFRTVLVFISPYR